MKNWQIPASPYTSEQKITLRHLLNHTSGVKNHIWQSIQPGQTIPELSVLLAGEANEPGIEIQFRPGERERYSNSGYAIVQKLIEDVTGEPFELALDKLVLEEVGMLDSSFGQPVPDRLREKLATGYSEDLQPYSYQLFPFKAAGGIWTTPTDLAHFMDKVMTSFHHQGDDFLSKGLLAQIFANKDDRLCF
ncbi:beta-lactamase family protein [Bowmanella sp. Y57]|uniref:Beta-lactamase family protein n=1 Tax=Bowmanella yangjiangensis TaxID=2811230 RepID=A0ABS3CTP8_9ALTE|nr:serine hydrolase domain-containing protein [Bowmanella yangjiangensis]MBN7820491.1 beta-lactamase family protein [Bowmanella yangjiangensis]